MNREQRDSVPRVLAELVGCQFFPGDLRLAPQKGEPEVNGLLFLPPWSHGANTEGRAFHLKGAFPSNYPVSTYVAQISILGLHLSITILFSMWEEGRTWNWKPEFSQKATSVPNHNFVMKSYTGLT